MSDGAVPSIPAWEPVGQVGRTSKFGDRKSKQEAFERNLLPDEHESEQREPTPGKGERDAAHQQPRRKADPDGTGRTLNVTA